MLNPFVSPSMTAALIDEIVARETEVEDLNFNQRSEVRDLTLALLGLLPPEEWRDVPGYKVAGLQASSWGRVRVLPYAVPMPRGPGHRITEVKPHYGHPDDENRPKMVIKRRTYRVCDLVCRAFSGKPPRRCGYLVRHLDEDNQSNRPANLKWGTNSQNQLEPKLRAYKSRITASRPRENGRFLKAARVEA